MRLCFNPGCCSALCASWPCKESAPCLLRLALAFEDGAAVLCDAARRFMAAKMLACSATLISLMSTTAATGWPVVFAPIATI